MTYLTHKCMPSVFLLFVSLLNSAMASAQPFDRSEEFSLLYHTFRQGTVLEDGRVLVSLPWHPNNDTSKWLEIDRNGVLLRSLEFTGYQADMIIPTPDNGFYSNFNLPLFESSQNSQDPDTLTIVFDVVKFDDNISTQSCKKLRRDFIDHEIGITPYCSLFKSPTSDGFLVGSAFGFTNPSIGDHLDLISISASNSIEWAITLGSHQWMNELYFNDYIDLTSEFKNTFIALDSNNNIYGSIFHDHNNLIVFGIRNDGTLKFAKSYGIAPGGPTSEEWQHIIPTSSGFHLALKKDIWGVGQFYYFLECDSLGDPVHLSRVELGDTFSEILSLHMTTDASYVLTTFEQVIEVPSQGNFAVRHETRRFDDGMFWRGQNIQGADLANDSLVLVGETGEQDQFLGSKTRGTFITRIPLGSFDQCVWKDTLITRSDMPLSLVTESDLTPDFAVMDITQEWSYVSDTVPFQLQPIPDPMFVERCSYFTSIDEANDELEDLSLFPSPIEGNGTLHVEATTGTHFRILDLTGRSVLAGRPVRSSDPWSIPLPGLKPGLYLLELMDAAGARTGTGRFLVE
ncbi:MAG: hypothetical protein KDB96_15355 [Flavobacteriales bacterium]|nr:hypothetical protein [Flavobacteriales bacterium]